MGRYVDGVIIGAEADRWRQLPHREVPMVALSTQSSAPLLPRRSPASDGPAPLEVALESLARTQPFTRLSVEGQLPANLRGTLYRNGPALFDSTGVDHWFDGVGGVVAVRIGDGVAEGAVATTVTPQLAAEMKRCRKTLGAYRFPASRTRRLGALLGRAPFANLANINVLPWQDRLLALYEAAPPIALDPGTLAPRGPDHLGGVVETLQAHPRGVASRRETWAIGMRIGRRAELDLYCLPDTGPARRVTTIPLPGIGEVHDFFVTERHAVLVLPPLWGRPLDFVRGGSFEGALSWRPELGTEIHVIPLDAPERRRVLHTDAFFFWHGAQAFEEGGRIVLDLVAYPDFGVSETLNRLRLGEPGTRLDGSLQRLTLDPATGEVSRELLADRSVEFPRIDPRREGARAHRLWFAEQSPAMGRRGWHDRILGLDPDTGDALALEPGPGCMVGEPIPVPYGPGEGDVHVLAIARDLVRGRSQLVVWDARRGPEPVARCHFDFQLHATLHGAWVPAG